MILKKWQFPLLTLLISSLLFLPTPFAESTSSGNPTHVEKEVIYTIKAGDTLWRISQKFLNNANDWKKLQTLNNIKNPHILTPNDTIRIPAVFLKPSIVSLPHVTPIQTAPIKEKKKSAIIKNIQGTAIITENNGQEKNAVLGMNIYVGEKITTHKSSSIRVEFNSGSSSNLQENSQLTIQELKPSSSEKTSHNDPIESENKSATKRKFSRKKSRNTKLYLHNGSLTNDVKEQKPNSHFIITTPSAVASVRGTIFRVASDPLTQQFRTEVLEGSVAVSNEGKSVVIKKGFGIALKKGQQPEKPQPLLDAAQLSGLQKSFVQTPVFFRFPAVNRAIAYRIELSKIKANEAASFQQQIFSKNITKPSIRLPHLKNGTYLMRVFSYDKNGLGGKVAYHQFDINVPSIVQPPAIPSLISPDEQAKIENENFSFRWSASSKNSNTTKNNGYHFQLASDPGFNQLLVDIFPYYYNELSIPDRLPSGQYYWHVGALDKQNKIHSYTDSRSFRVLPATPTLNDAQYNNHIIQLSWHTKNIASQKSSTSTQATVNFQLLSNSQIKALATIKYRLQIATDNQFTDIIIDTTLPENHYGLPRKTFGDLYIKVTNIGADGYFSPRGKVQHLRLEKKGFFDRQIINLNDE